MKAALIMPTHFSEHSVMAGGERYAYGLAKALSKHIQTALFTFADQNDRKKDGDLQIIFSKTLFPVGGLANPFSVHFIPELFQYDVIHCLQFPTIVTEMALLCGLAGKKKIFITDLAGGTYYSFSRLLPLWKAARGMLYISEFNHKLNHKYGAHPWRILYGGVDTDVFKPAPLKKDNHFLFVGRIFRAKGLHHLIEALPPGAHLDILGTCHDSICFDEIKALSRGKNINFHEGLPDQAILPFYQQSLATVLPSLADGGFTTALESMSCATPVIGTRLGSLPELIDEDRNGWTVPPGDVLAMRNRMIDLMNHPEKSHLAGTKAREAALTRFTWNHVAQRCLEAYQTL